MICCKLQKAHKRFSNVLTDFLDEYIEAIFWKKNNTLNLLTKVEPCAVFISEIYKLKIFSNKKLAAKIVKKCRMIVKDENQTSAAWKSFAKIIKAFSKHVRRSNELLSEYILSLELFFDVIEGKSLDSSTKSALQEAIDELDERYDSVINVKGANPSFKYFFGRFALKEKASPIEPNFSPPLKITNPEQCAKYFLVNLVSLISAKNDYGRTYFFLMEKEKVKYHDEIKKIEPDLIALCIETIKEQYSKQKEATNDTGKVSLSQFIASLINREIMLFDDYSKCINYVMDGVVNELNTTNILCFKNIVYPNLERTEKEASDEHFYEKVEEFAAHLEKIEDDLSHLIEVSQTFTNNLITNLINNLPFRYRTSH